MGCAVRPLLVVTVRPNLSLSKRNFSSQKCSNSPSPLPLSCFSPLLPPDLRVTRRLLLPTKRQRMQSGRLLDRLLRLSVTKLHWPPMPQLNSRLLPWLCFTQPTLGWSATLARSAPPALWAHLATLDPPAFVDLPDVWLLENKHLQQIV